MRRPPFLLLACCLLVVPLSGCTLGGPAPVPFDDVEADFEVLAAHAELNATAGHAVELPVRVACATNGSALVAPPTRARLVAANASGDWTPLVANATACTWSAFLPLAIPSTDEPGAQSLAVELRTNDDQPVRRDAVATLHVLTPGGIGFGANATAQIAYTARFADTGETFFTNDPALLTWPLDRSADYRSAPVALPARADSAGNLAPGMLALMLGMQPGETRAATLAPEEAYGNTTVLEREPRVEEILRDHVLPVEPEAMGWDTFAEHVRVTHQGDPAEYEAGDRFVVEQGGNQWRYRITELTRERVDYVLAPEVGDTFTLYPFWPNASVVDHVTPDAVTFYTTPTTAVGEPFTMRSVWPNMTSVTRVTDASVIVAHAPPAGHEYERRVPGGGVQRVEVVEVTDAHVVTAAQNLHALAGRSISILVRVLALDV